MKNRKRTHKDIWIDTFFVLQQGKGLVKVNGKPLSLVEPQILRFKVYEPILILGTDKFGMLHLTSSPHGSGSRIAHRRDRDAGRNATAEATVLTVRLLPTANVDIRVRVTGGGHTSQIYAIRQAISKSIVAYYQKYVDEYAKNQLKQALVQYDRTLLVADNRRCEPKKFGGPGARARYQKSYR